MPADASFFSSLADRRGPQRAVPVTETMAPIGASTSGSRTSGAIYVEDIADLRVEVVNETAEPLTGLTLEATSGNQDEPDSSWAVLKDWGGLAPAPTSVTQLVQNEAWRWVRLRAKTAPATTGAVSLLFSGTKA